MDATLPPIQIARGLYLGHEIHAATKPLLIEHNIHYIVNAAGNQVNNHFADFDFEYLPLDLYDTTADDIHQYFASTFEFIEKSQIDGRSCLVHCKSGKSRSVVIIMAYMMRKYRASLKHIFQLILLFTGGDVKPNNEFLAQLIDYEVELFGKSSMEEPGQKDAQDMTILTPQLLGLFTSAQGGLEDEEAQIAMYKKLRSLLLVNKWDELAKMSEESRNEDYEAWPIFQRLLRRALYSSASMQMNFVVEKVPTPTHPTTMLIHTFIEQTTNAICKFLPTTPESGYLSTFNHAISHTLGVVNVGVGSIFIDHLNQKLSQTYRFVHTGKLPTLPANPAESESKTYEEALEVLMNETKTHAEIVFGLFKFLSTDSNLVTYLEQYELALSQRLSVFLPLYGTPTHVLLGLETQIANLVPHPVHVEKIKRMISDILRVSDVSSSFEQHHDSGNATKGPKLEVAVLDGNAWPIATFTKHYDGTNIPMTILPVDLYQTWQSFKQFIQKSENESNQLLLLPHLGDAQLSCEFGGKQYILDVTTSMMLVLCCFNDNDGTTLSFKYLQNQLNLSPKLLAQTLYSLSQPKCQLIIKSNSKVDSIEETDEFSLNQHFSHKSRKFKVPNVKYSSATPNHNL